MLSRRTFLAGTAIVPAGLALASCTTNPTTGQLEINPAFVDEVVSLLQSGCAVGLSFIPTVSTVASVVAALFGPAAVATVQVITGAAEQVAAAICSAIPTAPAAQARLAARLARSSYSTPVLINTIKVNGTNVSVIGYR